MTPVTSNVRGSRPASPHLLVLTTMPLLTVVLGVTGIAVTRSYWLVAVTLLIALVAAAVLTIDLSEQTAEPAAGTLPAKAPPSGGGPVRPGPDFTGPPAAFRVLVIASEPVSAATVLAAAGRDPRELALGDLGVLVVAPEGAGHSDVTGDERIYRHARLAVDETVADLRNAGVAAAGHVGDHDVAQAIDDALVLFPADLVVQPSATERRLGEHFLPGWS